MPAHDLKPNAKVASSPEASALKTVQDVLPDDEAASIDHDMSSDPGAHE